MEIKDSPAFTINDTATFAAILRETQGNISGLKIVFYNKKSDEPNDLAQGERLRLVINAFDHLRCLTAQDTSVTSIDHLAAFIKSSKTLQTLEIIEHCVDDDETGEQFADALASSISLENIYITLSPTSTIFCSNFLRSLATPALAKRLKSLEIFLRDFDPNEHSNLIVEFLYKAEALEYLNLHNIIEWISDFPLICHALIESPAPLDKIEFELRDECAEGFPCECFVHISEVARRRTGLRDIDLAFYGSNDDDSLVLDICTEDSPRLKNLVDKRTADALISLRNSLERNQTLSDGKTVNEWADKILEIQLPDEENLHADVARMLVRHLLAHSASVAEFEKVMNSVLETLAIKRSLMSAQSFTNAAPTSTAAVSSVMQDSSN
jgi:hypothetical protein